MTFGLQTFVKGTSYDVVNSMDFNFVFDIFNANAGSGSRSYNNLPSCSFELVPISNLASTGSRTFSFSQSGKTVTWSSSTAVKVAVIATPKVGAEFPENNFGFRYYKNKIPYLSPNFVPFSLVQVLNVTPSTGAIIRTNVPAGKNVLVFHRGVSGIDDFWYTETTQAGFVALNVAFSRENTPARIYVFAQYLVNVPEHGFFMYRKGEMVWHSKCLPLRLQVINVPEDSFVVRKNTPMAIMSTVSGNLNLQLGGSGYRRIFTAPAAGWSGTQYEASTMGYRYINDIMSGSPPGGWRMPYVGYIDTAIYDKYYKSALGY